MQKSLREEADFIDVGCSRLRRRLVMSICATAVLLVAHVAFIVIARPFPGLPILPTLIGSGCCCGNWSCEGEDG